MNIALVGAPRAGSARACSTNVLRGHRVTAIAGDPAHVPADRGIMPLHGDVADAGALAGLLRGHDAAICAVPLTAADPGALAAAVRRAGMARHLVVGLPAAWRCRPAGC